MMKRYRMTEPHQRLDAELTSRAAELDVSWEAIAQAAGGMTTANIRSYRSGRTRCSGASALKLEDAVGWEHGSIERIYSGGRPKVIGHGLAVLRRMKAESLVAKIELARLPGETYDETFERLDRAATPARDADRKRSRDSANTERS